MLYYVHTDHLSRPVLMTSSLKVAVWQAVWSPFGEAHSITGIASTNLRFPGQWYQLDAGLHYNWHRHYDPSLGRYTQPDPLGFVDGPSVYAYAQSDPNYFVDPDGKMGITSPGIPTSLDPKPAKDTCDGEVEVEPVIPVILECDPIFPGRRGFGDIVTSPCFGGGGGGGGGRRSTRTDPNAADRARVLENRRLRNERRERQSKAKHSQKEPGKKNKGSGGSKSKGSSDPRPRRDTTSPHSDGFGFNPRRR